MDPTYSFDVFLSYDPLDIGSVRPVADRLRQDGFRVWMEESEIGPGDDTFLKKEDGLQRSRTLVLFMSENVFNSDWAGLERSTVLFRDPVNRERRFIPVLLANCQVPDTLGRYRCIDYRYQTEAAYQELCRAVGLLGMSAAIPPPTSTQIKDYLTTTLPTQIEEVNGKDYVAQLDNWFGELSADAQQQQGVRRGLLNPALPFAILVSAEFFAPGEKQSVYIPDIRQRLRELPQVALLGEPGAGKSFLLARLALDYAQDYETTSILPVFVPLSKYSTDQAFETFVAGRLGPVAELLPGMQVVWLLDALNEMTRSHGQWEHLKRFLLGLVDAGTRFVLTCRVKNYTTELAYVRGLYRVDLQDLNPQQIYDILERYLAEEAEEDVVKPRLQGEPAVDRIWKEVLHGDGLLEAWRNWTGSVRAFWERPEGYSWHWDDNERARQAVHDDPRKLMLLCRNPFILVRLLMRRICTVVAASDISPQNWQSALRMYLPNNRAELFGMVIEGMLAEEAQRQEWPPGDVQRVKSTLERTASALQATEQRTEMLLWDLGILAGWPSDGSDLLTKGRDAGLVTMSETEVRFTHQLFQEYFATGKLRDLLDDYDRRNPDWEAGPPLPIRDDRLSELFPNWWEVGAWRVTVPMLGEMEGGAKGIGRVVRWLAGYAPEIALMAVLENNDGVRVRDLSETVKQALITGAQARVNEPDPVGRAAAYRVLGHPDLDADRRAGVGTFVQDGARFPDIVWGEPVLPGVYPVGGDKKAYDPLPARKFRLEYSYRLSKYPVTNSQFQAFVDAGAAGYNDPVYWTEAGLAWKGTRQAPDPLPDGAFRLPNHPRVRVTWYEAMAFCAWLSVRSRALGLIDAVSQIRLPTEIEWEICARGHDGLDFPYGKKFDASKGNVLETGIEMTSAVGLFPDGKSPYEVLDMSGNVWEWCLTSYEDGSNDPSGGASRVLRGGSWAYYEYNARAGARFDDPDGWAGGVGFRVVSAP